MIDVVAQGVAETFVGDPVGGACPGRPLDRVLQRRLLYAGTPGERLAVNVTLEPLVLHQLIITSSPAAVYSEDNLRIRHKMGRLFSEMSAPLLTAIIEQGNREGSFNAAHPESFAKMIWGMRMAQADELIELVFRAATDPEAEKELMRDLDAFEDAMARLLGAEPASINLMAREKLQLFFKTIREEG